MLQILPEASTHGPAMIHPFLFKLLAFKDKAICKLDMTPLKTFADSILLIVLLLLLHNSLSSECHRRLPKSRFIASIHRADGVKCI